MDESGEKSQLYRTSSKRLNAPLLITVVLLLGVLLAGGYVFFQAQHPTENTESPLPTAAPTVLPSETPTPTLEASPTAKLTTTPGKTTPTAKPSGVLGTTDRSSISVTVLNGSGTPGAASKVAEYLKGLGYTISSTGNAETFDYTGLTISVKSGKASIVTQLKKDLSSQGTVEDTSTTYTGSADAEVIVGE